MRKLLGLLIVVAAVVVSGSLVTLAAGTFIDDDGNTHEPNIEAIAADGITRGCNPPTNNLYCPEDEVTRGEMAAFIVRALEPTDDGGQDWFTDDDAHLFENDINILAAAGITRGCDPPANTQYCPDDPVTRGAMAAFLVRAFDYTEGVGADLFDDDDGHTFENDIDKLGTAGVTKGCNPPDNNLYCPDENVLRDQMASFLARAKGLDPIIPEVESCNGARILTVHYEGDDGSQDPNEEWVTIRNVESVSIDFTGCSLEDQVGHTYLFPEGFELAAGAQVRVFSGSGTDSAGSLYWGSGSPIWNNTGDLATLYNNAGHIVDIYSY